MQKTKGILIIIGGDLSLPTSMNGIESNDVSGLAESEGQILQKFCELLPGENPRIEIVPTASNIPEKTSQRYIQSFQNLGFQNIGSLDIRSREQAQSQEVSDRVRVAAGFLFTGGDQLRLTTLLGGTEFLSILQERYKREPVLIAGTSAGAMAMADIMIYQGNSHEALKKGEVRFSSGFGLLPKVIIDTHFVKRGRIGRLFQAVAGNPGCLGIGLGEDTGLLIVQGNIQEAIGSGLIIIVDGSSIRYTNMALINEGELISIENLSVHVMVPGDKFLLSERKFIPAQVN